MKAHIIQTPANGMSYGECVQKEINSMQMIDGVFIKTLHILCKPRRLSTKLDGKGGSEAGRYYNNKLKKDDL